MAADLKAAQAVHPELAAALKAVPPYRHDLDEETNAARLAALTAFRALITSKGSVRERYDGTAVVICGLRASSTMGLEAACRNWMAQVTLKSMAANAEASA